MRRDVVQKFIGPQDFAKLTRFIGRKKDNSLMRFAKDGIRLVEERLAKS